MRHEERKQLLTGSIFGVISNFIPVWAWGLPIVRKLALKLATKVTPRVLPDVVLWVRDAHEAGWEAKVKEDMEKGRRPEFPDVTARIHYLKDHGWIE